MLRRKLYSTVFVLGCTLAAHASTLTININGTLGPLLSGGDPLGGNGGTGSITLTASESLTPTSTGSHSATYTLPAGAVSVTVGTTSYVTTAPSKMTVKLTSTADVLTVTSTGPFNTVVTGTAFLAAGSWRSSVLLHPGAFSPSPQTLSAAVTATGPGSKVKYTFLGSTTVLGVSGTISSTSAADPVLPDDDSEK